VHRVAPEPKKNPNKSIFNTGLSARKNGKKSDNNLPVSLVLFNIYLVT